MAPPEPGRTQAVPRRRYDVNERMAAVLAVQRELGMHEMDVQGLQDSAAARAMQLTQAGGALVEVTDGAHMVARCALGLVAPLRGRRVDVLQSATLRAVRDAEVHRADDATQDPLVDPTLVARFGIRSALTVPLQQDGRVLGAFTLVAPDAGAFDDFDALTLQFLASVVVVGMDRWAQYKARHQLLDERGLAQRARKVADERLRVLFQEAPVGLAVLGDDFEIHDANDALCALAGHSRDELLFRHFPGLLHPDDGASVKSATEDLHARLLRRDGALAQVRIRLRALPSAPGETPRVLAVVEDREARDPRRRAAAPKEAPPKEAAPQLAVARVDLAPVLARSLRAFQSFAVRNSVRVEARIAPTLPVRGDPSLLEHAARSAVENVFRSARGHGAILVQAAVTGGAVVVQFSGPSLLAERVAALFQVGRPDPFASYAGRDGLGLDEAHRIVSLHGGKMWWRQTPQGVVLGFSLAAA